MKWELKWLYAKEMSVFLSCWNGNKTVTLCFSQQNYPPRWLLTRRELGVHHHHLQQHPAVNHGHRQGHGHFQHELWPLGSAGNDSRDTPLRILFHQFQVSCKLPSILWLVWELVLLHSYCRMMPGNSCISQTPSRKAPCLKSCRTSFCACGRTLAFRRALRGPPSTNSTTPLDSKGWAELRFTTVWQQCLLLN